MRGGCTSTPHPTPSLHTQTPLPEHTGLAGGSQSLHPWGGEHGHTWIWHSHSRNLLQLPAKDRMQWPKEGLTSIPHSQDSHLGNFSQLAQEHL